MGVDTDAESQNRRARAWQLLTYVLGATLCALTLRWHALDRAPTGWDDSAYLLQAVRLYRTDGWSSFWHELFFYDRGRVGLITIMAQPFLAVFGPTVDAAMIPFALAWPAAAWAIGGIARGAGTGFFGLDTARASAGGFFALLLFAAYPMTGFLTQLYLVDYPLAVFAVLTLRAAMGYRDTPNATWLVALGFFAGCGMMTKVTFPVFALPALLIHGRTLLDTGEPGRRRHAAAIPPAVAALICGPYYAVNIIGLVRTTGLLSSAALAHTFGFARALDVHEIVQFLSRFFTQYEYGLSTLAAVLFIAAVARRRPRPAHFRWGVFVFTVWFLVPVAFVTLSPFKQDRYFYGALPALAVMGGLALAMLTRVRCGAAILAVLLLLPIAELAAINGAPVPARVRSHLGIVGRPPDPSGHRVTDMVSHIAHTLAAGPATPRTVSFLSGAGRFCNASLFTLTALQQGIPVTFTYLPAFETPGMTPEEAVSYLQSKPHDAILVKTGVSFPETFAALDRAIVPLLEATGAYRRRDLPFPEPDSCSLALFVRKTIAAP
jgi:hypothetical protein